jgi:Flp pilus assembly protein TadD
MSRRRAVLMILPALALMAGPGCRTLGRPRGSLARANVGTSRADDGVIRAAAPQAPAEPEAAAAAPLRPSPDQDVHFHIDLGRAFDAQGAHEKALAEYQEAVRRYRPETARQGSPASRARLHRRLAGALDHLGRFDEARAHYRQAQRLAPEDPDVWNDTGYSAYLQGRWDEAERLIARAARLDPGATRAATNLGLVQAATGRTEAALATWTRALGPAAARMNLGFALAAQGRVAEARAHYVEALRLQPDLAEARQALAKLEQAQAPPSPGATAAGEAASPPSAMPDAGGVALPLARASSPDRPRSDGRVRPAGHSWRLDAKAKRAR